MEHRVTAGKIAASMRRRPSGMDIDGCPHHVLCHLAGVDFVEHVVSPAGLAGDHNARRALSVARDAVDRDLVAAGIETSEAVRLTITACRHPELFALRPPELEVHPSGRWGSANRIAKELRRWRRPRHNRPPSAKARVTLGSDTFELHSLVCARDVPMSLWSLKSFFAHSELRPRVVIHDDGTLTQAHRALYAEHFEGIEILDDKAASARMDGLLKDRPACRRFRRRPDFYCARKLFDPVFLAQSDYVLLVDSDILFFADPAALLEHVRSGQTCFGSDYQNAYSSPLAELESWRGQPVLPCVNAGLLGVPVEQYRAGMGLVEEYLAHAESRLPEVPVNRHEQTAHALLMSAIGATRLPSTHALSGPIDARTVSFHFVDDGTNRPRFWSDGVPAIHKAVARMRG